MFLGMSARRFFITVMAGALSLSSTGCAFFGAGAAVAAGAATGGAVASAGLSDSPDDSGAKVPARAAIRITFDGPRDLTTIHQARRDTNLLRRVAMVIGRVEVIHGDTIRLLDSEARHSDGSTSTYPRNRVVVLVPRDSRMAVHVISRRPAVTEGAAIGTGIGLVFAIGILAAAFLGGS